jgi:hypothetical protein
MSLMSCVAAGRMEMSRCVTTTVSLFIRSGSCAGASFAGCDSGYKGISDRQVWTYRFSDPYQCLPRLVQSLQFVYQPLWTSIPALIQHPG